MSQNAFNQLAADLEEDQEMREHEKMEREAYAAMSIVESASVQLGTKMAMNLDAEIYEAICHHTGSSPDFGFIASEMKNRGKFIVRPDKIQVFEMDGVPLLEIHSMQVDMNGTTLNATQRIRKLYPHGTTQENT